MALKCKEGRCENAEDISGNVNTGCKPKLEDFKEIECDEDSVCYKEHQEPYGGFNRKKYLAIFPL